MVAWVIKNKVMNVVQKSARKIIKLSFNLSVWTIDYFSKMEIYHKKVTVLRELDDGTLGREIVRCLDDNNLTLVPKYESHDLKHVLLGYQMTPEDEIRMQAFMIGNGNYSLPSFAILGFGTLLLPELCGTFIKDFQKGRRSEKIADWTIEEYGHRDLVELQTKLTRFKSTEKTPISMRTIIKYGALTSITAGVFGMIYCLPFLFSSQIEDIVGAGFPFVGGAILATGGLLALTKSQQAPDLNKELKI
ncbi:MAG: hypothetical protein COA38_09950 [Fluviicola sp.]|nr:MAG: hypothetical protein COA38_09950 [Fluviicola sp.]